MRYLDRNTGECLVDGAQFAVYGVQSIIRVRISIYNTLVVRVRDDIIMDTSDHVLIFIFVFIQQPEDDLVIFSSCAQEREGPSESYLDTSSGASAGSKSLPGISSLMIFSPCCGMAGLQQSPHVVKSPSVSTSLPVTIFRIYVLNLLLCVSRFQNPSISINLPVIIFQTPTSLLT